MKWDMKDKVAQIIVNSWKSAIPIHTFLMSTCSTLR